MRVYHRSPTLWVPALALIACALVALGMVPSAGAAAPLPLPEDKTLATASEKQIRDAVQAVLKDDAKGAEALLRSSLGTLKCRDTRPAAILLEECLRRAPDDLPALLKAACETQPCQAALHAAVAAGLQPKREAEIVAIAQAAVAAARGTGGEKNPGGKNPAGKNPVADKNPASASGLPTDEQIEIAVRAGVLNGPVTAWLWSGKGRTDLTTGFLRFPGDYTSSTNRPARPPQSGETDPSPTFRP